MKKMLAVVMLTASLPIFAAKPAAVTCNRNITLDYLQTSNWLSDAEKTELEQGAIVEKAVAQYSGYHMVYVMQQLSFSPATLIGIVAQPDEQPKLGDFFIQTKALATDPAANPVRVLFEQKVNWPYSNAQYTSLNTVNRVTTANGQGYRLTSELVASADTSFSPAYFDYYLSAVAAPHGKTLVTACAYAVPHSANFKGMYNSLSYQRLKTYVQNLSPRAQAVLADQALYQQYQTELTAKLAKLNAH